MVTHLIDTSIYCQPLKPQPLKSVIERWTKLGDEALSISVICEAELLYGLKWKNSRKLFSRYESFLKGRLEIYPVDEAVAKKFADIKVQQRKSGRMVADLDLLIASTAMVRKLSLVTLNVAHFSHIKRVRIEDWTQ